MSVAKQSTGFKNPYTRRGTWQDSWLRRKKLQNTRPRLPKARDLPKLQEVAEEEMRRVRAELGVSDGVG
jgi:hypothetical protein